MASKQKHRKDLPGPALDAGTLPELLGYRLRLAQQAVFRDYATSVQGLSPGRVGLLITIDANPGVTQSRLAEAVNRDRSTMVAVLDQLEAEHIHGAKLIRDLEQDLLRWEMGGDKNFSAFAEKVKQYGDFHWRHMRQEEQVVLPLAERALTEEDWREIDAAFSGNADPLIDKEVGRDFEHLFKRIVNLAPPPIGIGHEN